MTQGRIEEGAADCRDESSAVVGLSANGSPVSSTAKSRRVSFADPEVSQKVDFSPPPPSNRLSRCKSRRALIPPTTADSSTSDSMTEDTPSVEIAEVAIPTLEEDGAPLATALEPSAESGSPNTIDTELAAYVSSAVPKVFVNANSR